MCQQTILPAEWVIVDDGSSDQTGQIAESYAAKHPWIRVYRRPDRGTRKAGGGVIEAFNDGYLQLRGKDWEFLVKLDGDLSFAANYFERCFDRFRDNPEIGIAGGAIYHEKQGKRELERNPRFHVRGATKIYRRRCWDAIGGLVVAPGWDTLDEVKANMLGWKTLTFPELQVLHHRLTGTAESIMRDRVKHGVACYVSGYHPLFVLASCVRRTIQKPYLLGSAAILYGFLKSYVSRSPRPADKQLVHYLRTQQLKRLCGLETIWK